MAAVALPRSRTLLSLASAALSLLLAGTAAADDLRFFQIGTGPTGETRFSLGGLIANALSNPPGARSCAKGGSCGVPGMVAVATSTTGAAADIAAVASHSIDAALVDANVAYWAVKGMGPFKGKPVANLRGIAMIYPESLHLVVRHGSPVHSLADLRGRRVSVGDESGPLAPGRLLLAAAGLSDKDVKLKPMAADAAANALAAGQTDAMLVTDAWPVPEVAELARTTPVDVIALAGPAADKVVAERPYFTAGEIAANAYEGLVQPVKTVDMGVVLVTSAEADAGLISGITRALWHPSTRKLLADGNIHGKRVRLDHDSLARLELPLHPGAAAVYAEAQPAH